MIDWTDKDRFDWLEKQEGYALISDDFGSWAVTGEGLQEAPEDPPQEFATTFYIAKEKLKPTIREAIDYAYAVDNSI